MGLISTFLNSIFGGGRNAIVETAELFRENAEAGADRAARYQEAALGQFAAEFAQPRKGRFDRFIDGLNRVPRPALALGTIGLFIAALTDPIWFAERMQGIALVPQPLWWLMGAIVSFYFGARHQAKGQDFQRSIAATVALAPQVQANMASLRALEAGAGKANVIEGAKDDGNAALEAWREGRNQ